MRAEADALTKGPQALTPVGEHRENGMRTRPWELCLVLLAVCLPSGAQTIYTCKPATGALRYQSAPCTGDARSQGTREYTPIVNDPAAAARLREIEAQMAQRRAAAAYGGASVSRRRRVAASRGDPRTRQRFACETAKQSRQATLDRVGLKRTLALLRGLDARVAQACLGI